MAKKYTKTIAFRVTEEQWKAIEYVTATQEAFGNSTTETLRVIMAGPLQRVVDSYNLAIEAGKA